MSWLSIGPAAHKTQYGGGEKLGTKSRLLYQLQLPLKQFQNLRQFVTALENRAVTVDDAVSTLLASEFGILLDAIECHFAGASIDGKDGAIFQMVDGIIAPFTISDLKAVNSQNGRQFPAIETDLRRGDRIAG